MEVCVWPQLPLGKFLRFAGPALDQELKGELSQRTGLNIATGAEACKASPALLFVSIWYMLYEYILIQSNTC